MVYDVIIIGAGIMGSSTAFQLTEQGKKCLLIDRFPLLHNKGSSHGDSRIIRKSYNENHFAKLMIEAYHLWNDLESQYHQQFIVRTGGLDFGVENSSEMKNVENTLKNQHLDHESLSHTEIMKRFSAFRLKPDQYGIYQSEAGIVLASKVLHFFQETAQKKGLEVLTGEKVSLIKEEYDYLVVMTKSKTFKTKKVVICVGSWINEFFKNYRIDHRTTILPVNYGYWKVNKPDIFRAGAFPIFIAWGEKVFYGLGSLERENYFKIGAHYSYNEQFYRQEDFTKHSSKEITNDLVSVVKNTFPEADNNHYELDSCYYTMNDNENFIIDFHPDNDNIIFGGGFSGHGFKFAPLIGKILSDLARNGETGYDISKFRFGRF